MAVFGQSLETVRFLGSAAVGLTAVILQAIARRYLSLWAAVTLASLFVVANADTIGDSTKSELIANGFVAGSLLLLLSQSGGNWRSFGAGLLIGCAVLVRTNLGVLAVAVAMVHLLAVFRPEWTSWRGSAFLALCAGGLVPLVAVIAPYAIAGELPLLWVGAVDVALSQAGTRDLVARLILIPHSMVRILLSPMGLLVVVAVIGIRRAPEVLRNQPKLRTDWWLGWVYLLAIWLSIILSGAFYNHYMAQLLPPLVLLSSIGLSGKDWGWRRDWTGRLLLAGTVAGAVWFTALGVMVAIHQSVGKVDRPLAEAASAIRPHLLATDRVWAVDDTHLVLFYLDRDPVLPVAAFPANLTKSHIATRLVQAGLLPPEGPRAVLAMRPKFVVTSHPGAPRQLQEDDRRQFDAMYDLWWSGTDRFVYRLR